MLARLLYHKWGTYPDEKTGEMKTYDKIVVCGVDVAESAYNGHLKRGMLQDDYRIDNCNITSAELESMYGKIVDLDFDHVIGSKYPNVVRIKLHEEV